MKFSPLPCHLVPPRPIYSPQRPILKQDSDYVPPSMSATKFHTHSLHSITTAVFTTA
jgi:hypothetical protein